MSSALSACSSLALVAHSWGKTHQRQWITRIQRQWITRIQMQQIRELPLDTRNPLGQDPPAPVDYAYPVAIHGSVASGPLSQWSHFRSEQELCLGRKSFRLRRQLEEPVPGGSCRRQ